MLKKPLTFKDFFTEQERTEEFYFHLTRSELIELEAHFGGGIEAGIRRIVEAEDNETLVKEFKAIIMLSYGKKVGNGFDKSDEAKKEFASSPAFDELFMELVGDEKSAAEFINGIMPTGFASDTTATEAKANLEAAAAAKATPPVLPNLAEQVAAQKAASPPIPPSA